jgi:hypothetical protein
MIERQTTETHTRNDSWIPLVLIVAAALVIALVVWQPWSATSRDSSTTTNQSTTTQTTAP